MSRHAWVAAADDGLRWGLQTVVPNDRQALPRLLETAKSMESLGYDSLFIMDHPAMHADPFVALAGVASVTDSIMLGQLVLAAAYRHPAYTARLQADLDNLSGGRSILGVGSGWFEAEYEMMAIPFPGIGTRQRGLDEMMTIVDGVWGSQPYVFDGGQFQVREMRVEPAPATRPPVLVGGSGEKTTLRQVATWGDACNLRESISPEEPASKDEDRFAEVEHKYQVLDGHCDVVGRPRNEVLKSHFTTYLLIANTQQEADAKADAVDTSVSTSAGTRSRGRKFIFAAGIDRAIDYYRGMKVAGSEYFVVQVDQYDEETIQLLAEKVMPAVAD